MTDEKDPKRITYERSLRGIVDAMHGLQESFEVALAAAKEWDPDNSKSEPDPVQHAAITSCRALMASIFTRHAGAAEMLFDNPPGAGSRGLLAMMAAAGCHVPSREGA